MKLKYYLRGLGIGIAVTALVLMLAGGANESLTDEEIIERAKELGMVESVTLSQLSTENVSEDVNIENSESVSEVNSDEEQEAQSSETSELVSSETESEEVSEEDVSSSEEVASEQTSEDTSQTQPSEVIDEYVVVEVGSGDGSDTVSRKLEALGMVEDAQMYDDFLCANGYDKILQTGVHEIPKDADWDTIAEILAGRM